jgi:ribosomal protein S18 acetylase RimI-like enzyme
MHLYVQAGLLRAVNLVGDVAMNDVAVQASHRLPKSIRSMTPGDAGAVAGLIDATGLFPSHLLAGMVSPFFSGSAGDDQWVVVDELRPIAVAYWSTERMTQGAWNLLLIAVHPRWQGQGVGSELLDHVEQELAASGQRILLVETSGLPEFERTRAFYRRCGYDEEARIRDYYEAGEDKIVFRKALTLRLV